ncbi:MAG: class F sortase [Microthrixaceae bacterium]
MTHDPAKRWRSTALIVVCSMALLAVGAIQLGQAGAQPRADLADSVLTDFDPAGSVPAGSDLTGSDPIETADAAPGNTAPGDTAVDKTATGNNAAGNNAAGAPPVSEPALPAVPTGLSIPSLGVLAPVVPVGLGEDRSMQIPGVSEAGWYLPGRAPGSPTGSAVIAAHVDFNERPGVFFELRGIQPGAEVVVTDAAGGTHRFVVTERTQVAKDRVPMQELFRTGGDPVLTLVTCGGAFDSGARSYSDNIIVRAVPVAA